MRVIDALRYIHAEWVMFGDMDENDCHKVFTKPMKTKKYSVGQASQDRVEMGIVYKFQQKGRNIDNSLFRKATDI